MPAINSCVLSSLRLVSASTSTRSSSATTRSGQSSSGQTAVKERYPPLLCPRCMPSLPSLGELLSAVEGYSFKPKKQRLREMPRRRAGIVYIMRQREKQLDDGYCPCIQRAWARRVVAIYTAILTEQELAQYLVCTQYFPSRGN